MLPENIKDIQQRLHELNAEEARFLADIQVSLAGMERVHAQRRMEELTLVELQRKSEDGRREREDRKPRMQQGRQRKHGQGGNKKRNAEEQPRRSELVKRQKRRGPSNAYGEQSVPMPGRSNYGNRNQRQNQQLPRECKCSRVDVHCGGNGSTCQVCKALGCAGAAQSHYRNRKRNSEHHRNVPGVTSAASTWPQHTGASIINVDVLE